MLTVGSGASLAWSPDPLATVAQADEYASGRGWTDWEALNPTQKALAVSDSSTYVKITYAPPAYYTAAQQTLIEQAAIEAARLTLSGPLIGAVEAPQVLREKLKDLETEYAEVKPGSTTASRLAFVSALLRAAGLIGGTSINVPLRKA